MEEIKLSKLKDGGTFFISKRSKIEYEVVKREKKGMTLISATISARTYLKKNTLVVYIISKT